MLVGLASGKWPRAIVRRKEVFAGGREASNDDEEEAISRDRRREDGGEDGEDGREDGEDGEMAGAQIEFLADGLMKSSECLTTKLVSQTSSFFLTCCSLGATATPTPGPGPIGVAKCYNATLASHARAQDRRLRLGRLGGVSPAARRCIKGAFSARGVVQCTSSFAASSTNANTLLVMKAFVSSSPHHLYT